MRYYGKIRTSIMNIYPLRVLSTSPPLHRSSCSAQTARPSKRRGYCLVNTNPYASLITYSPGHKLPNNLRHRRRPPRRPLPFPLLSTLFRSIYLLLLPNMGQPQPNLLQRPSPYKNLPILLRQNQRPRLRWHALHHRTSARRQHHPFTRLRPQPHRR